MPSYTGATSYHKTLTGTTVDTVTLTGSPDRAEVSNRSGSATLWLTKGASAAAPVAEANGTDFVLPGQSLEIEMASDGVVQILGNANAYSVVAL